jgi:hypothetical protein
MFEMPTFGPQTQHIATDIEIDCVEDQIRLEVRSAERKFDQWPICLIRADQIVNEEKGEASRALNYIPQGKASLADAEKEYVQTAAMCIRQLVAIRRLKEQTTHE